MTVLCSRITCLSSQLTPFRPVISLNLSLPIYLDEIIILCRFVALMSVKRADKNSGCLEPIRPKKKCNQIEIIRFFKLVGIDDILSFADDTTTTFTCSSNISRSNFNCLFSHYLPPWLMMLFPISLSCFAST